MQREMKEELKLCPFCGSSAHKSIANQKWIFCDGCRCSMDSIEEWNKRKTISVERIEEIIKSSELWRMSNYKGRDISYSNNLNGTQELAKTIKQAIEE